MTDLEDMFYRSLSGASYHRADDSGKEWSLAYAHIAEAARIASEAGWDEAKIRDLMSKRNSLVTAGEVIEKMEAKS